MFATKKKQRGKADPCLCLLAGGTVSGTVKRWLHERLNAFDDQLTVSNFQKTTYLAERSSHWTDVREPGSVQKICDNKPTSSLPWLPPCLYEIYGLWCSCKLHSSGRLATILASVRSDEYMRRVQKVSTVRISPRLSLCVCTLASSIHWEAADTIS